MEPEDSLSCSQQPSTGPYPKPKETDRPTDQLTNSMEQSPS